MAKVYVERDPTQSLRSDKNFAAENKALWATLHDNNTTGKLDNYTAADRKAVKNAVTKSLASGDNNDLMALGRMLARLNLSASDEALLREDIDKAISTAPQGKKNATEFIDDKKRVASSFLDEDYTVSRLKDFANTGDKRTDPQRVASWISKGALNPQEAKVAADSIFEALQNGDDNKAENATKLVAVLTYQQVGLDILRSLSDRIKQNPTAGKKVDARLGKIFKELLS